MSTENLTAEQALDEVLNRVFGIHGEGWRMRLASVNFFSVEDHSPTSPLPDPPITAGDLRRWAAPLLSTEG